MSSKHNMIQTADAIFVGAGPVGLYTAIQAKLYQPNLKIVMLERHETYLRHHILRIDKNSYKGSHPNPDFQKVLAPLKGMVPTSTIENALLKYAKSLGIEVLHQKVESIQSLKEEAANARFIVGSDGARSLVRREIFNDEKHVDSNLQYIVEIKYKAKAHQQSSRKTPKNYALGTYEYITSLSQCDHFITENIGKEKDGEVPISLFVFVDQQTHDEVKALNTTPGKRLGLLDIPTTSSTNLFRLSNSIRTWLAARKATNGECFITGSEKIAGVALPIYHSKQFITQKEDKTILLIGDASMGVPYFRALNAGLIGANHAAKLIANIPLAVPKRTILSSSQYQTEALSGESLAYQNHLTNLAHIEIASALKTNLKVNIGQKASYVGQTLLQPSSMSLMDDDLLFTIQQARLDKPNIIARNPHFIAALFAWATVTTLCATLFSVSMTYLIPISVSMLIFICAFKLAYELYETSVMPPKPEFAWEQEANNESTDIERQPAPNAHHGFFRDDTTDSSDLVSHTLNNHTTNLAL